MVNQVAQLVERNEFYTILVKIWVRIPSWFHNPRVIA